MKRVLLSPRANWKSRLEEHGFAFHSLGNSVYWDESVAYQFTERQILELEKATRSVFSLCMTAVDHVIHRNRFAELKIPESWAELCRQSWNADDPTIYGRFDFSYSGDGLPKMLEFNADTPTALLEAAVAQWVWLEDGIKSGLLPENADQFNSIHEKLLEQLGFLRARRGISELHFASVLASDEDYGTVAYLRDVAHQVGMKTKHLGMNELGWNQQTKKFVDLKDTEIQNLFKLYPWEHLQTEPFGQHLLNNSIKLIEPAWKMILSNKGILPILWELSPGHPNLLEASFTPLSGNRVRKPFFSREGANIRIEAHGQTQSSSGQYGSEGYIYQAYAGLPNFDGAYPVIGSWIIGDMAAGIGIREDSSEITKDTSRFVPHFFL